MGDRFNTVAGWALFAGIIALGGAIVSSKYFHDERPEKMGYAIEGVEVEGEGGGDSGPGLNTLLASADVAAGEKVFALCRSCHVLEDGVNRVGPSLYKVVGRKSGSVAGFSYSDANKNSGVTWTTDVLFKYLEDPKGFMPGTKMAFPGIKDAQDRANLVAYLESQSK